MLQSVINQISAWIVARLNALKSKISAVEQSVTNLASTVTTLSSTVDSGLSNRYTKSEADTAIDTAKQAAITTAATDATSKANAARDAAKTYAEEQDQAQWLQVQNAISTAVAAAADDIDQSKSVSYDFASLTQGQSASVSIAQLVTDAGVEVGDGEKAIVHFTDNNLSAKLAGTGAIYVKSVSIGTQAVALGGHVVLKNNGGTYEIVSVGGGTYLADILAVRSGVNAAISTVTDSVTTLEGRVQTAEGNITNLQNNKVGQSEVDATALAAFQMFRDSLVNSGYTDPN